MEVGRIIKAGYKDGKVVVHLGEDVNVLRQRGFGSWVRKVGLVLSPYETLYLMEKEIRVVDAKTEKEIKFLDLLEEYRSENPSFWVLYLIYRDLRSKGFVVKEGGRPDIDFKVFERGKYGKEGPRFAVVRISEGELTAVNKMVKRVDIARCEELELVLAVVDRRNEVVYYSLSEMQF